jgi:anaerobic ribonucleoside-triphosphate reductase activating protein
MDLELEFLFLLKVVIFIVNGCFNSETWNFEDGKDFTDKTLETLLALCEDNKIKGLSILGGEPLNDENFQGVKNIVCAFRNKFIDDTKKDIWLWTGYEFEDIYNHPQKSNILLQLDYMICGPFIEEQKDLSLKYRGSSNQRVVDVQKSLKEGRAILVEGM